MALKPWHKVATPREDLREGKTLEASQFAVKLDRVVRGEPPEVYRDPEKFFERTYLPEGFIGLAASVLRRLAGEENGEVVSLTTQFGGGKTHFLTLLYHLVKGGEKADQWPGVREILSRAGLKSVPETLPPVVFVGSAFDPLVGAGGNGEPHRKTFWGELAWQIGGAEGYRLVAEHDERGVRPGGDLLRKILPKDRAVLILVDEFLNYAAAVRRSGYRDQLYHFFQILTQEASDRRGVCLLLSLPYSEVREMTPEDREDFDLYRHLATREASPELLSQGPETREIIRRRLFEEIRDPKLEKDRKETARAFARWTQDNREFVPEWVFTEEVEEAFERSYPFHPSALSVFERKWQAIPGFQRTRGMLRLLALWVSWAYKEAYEKDLSDPLIGLGSAPLEDQRFRAAVFEQLGEERLEAAVTADVAGDEAFAVRLDGDPTATDTLRAAKLHRRVAAAVFFESTGGQKDQVATLREVQYAVCGPGVEVGHVGTALDNLNQTCHYLNIQDNRYHFSWRANLTRVVSQREEGIGEAAIQEKAREAIHEVFRAGGIFEVRPFPENSGAIPNAPVLSLVVLPPGRSWDLAERGRTRPFVEDLIQNAGASSRTYKSALILAAPSSAAELRARARKALAWESLEEEGHQGLDESQLKRIGPARRKAEEELKTAVWRAYKWVILLDKKGELKTVDLGVPHPSAAKSLQELILMRLRQEDEVTPSVGASTLKKNWPGATDEWSTKAVKEVFYQSPRLPRLLNPESLRQTIHAGVREGTFGYGVRDAEGNWVEVKIGPGEAIQPEEVEFSDDAFLIPAERAREIKEALQKGVSPPPPVGPTPPGPEPPGPPPPPPPGPARAIRALRWEGELPPAKWMTFYTKVLSALTTLGGLVLRVKVEASPTGGLSEAKVSEVRLALGELGLEREVETEAGKGQGEAPAG